MRLQMTIILFLMILFFHSSKGQLVNLTVEQVEQYLKQNIDEIYKIEGIYNIDIEFHAGLLKCKECDIKELKVENHDKVAIIRNKDKFIVYSFNLSKQIGYFFIDPKVKPNSEVIAAQKSNQKYIEDNNLTRKATSSYRNFHYSYIIQNINSDGASIPENTSINPILLIKDDVFELHSNIDYQNISSKYGYDIASKLSITCPDNYYQTYGNSTLFVLCANYSIKHRFKKIFPLADYTPEPTFYYGTGFFVDSQGFLVTNYHVIKEYYIHRFGWMNKDYNVVNNASINIITNNKMEHIAEIVAIDKKNDLAVLKVRNWDINFKKRVPYSITKSGKIGQEVFSLGYPLKDFMGTNIKLTRGFITSNSGIDDDSCCFTLDLAINPGNSGGPLFSKNGEVLGVVYSRLSEENVGTKVENVSYGIKSEYLIKLLKDNNIKTNLVAPTQKQTELTQLIDNYSEFIVIVKVRGKY